MSESANCRSVSGLNVFSMREIEEFDMSTVTCQDYVPEAKRVIDVPDDTIERFKRVVRQMQKSQYDKVPLNSIPLDELKSFINGGIKMSGRLKSILFDEIDTQRIEKVNVKIRYTAWFILHRALLSR